jgi:hypothetical protein
MREHNNVAQRKDGIDINAAGDDGLVWVAHDYPELPEPAFPSAPLFLRLGTFDDEPALKPTIKPSREPQAPRIDSQLSHPERHERIGRCCPKDGRPTRKFQAVGNQDGDQLARSARSA